MTRIWKASLPTVARNRYEKGRSHRSTRPPGKERGSAPQAGRGVLGRKKQMSGKPNYAARSIKGHERPDPNIGPPTASAFSRTDNQCFVDPLRPTSRGSYEGRASKRSRRLCAVARASSGGGQREAVLAAALHPLTAKCAGSNFA